MSLTCVGPLEIQEVNGKICAVKFPSNIADTGRVCRFVLCMLYKVIFHLEDSKQSRTSLPSVRSSSVVVRFVCAIFRKTSSRKTAMDSLNLVFSRVKFGCSSSVSDCGVTS